MKIWTTISEENDKLILFFAGWSASPDLFTPIELPPHTDICICYDYRDLDTDFDLYRYSEITVVAWSLGVWVANHIMSKHPARYKKKIAINGTLNPINDSEGIPEAIFEATLQNVTPDGMNRFNRRICGSKKTLELYQSLESRPTKDLLEELEFLYSIIKNTTPITYMEWDIAIISENDLIFPVTNMDTFWNKRSTVKHIKAPHYPFNLWKHWNEVIE